MCLVWLANLLSKKEFYSFIMFTGLFSLYVDYWDIELFIEDAKDSEEELLIYYIYLTVDKFFYTLLVYKLLYKYNRKVQ